MGPAGSARLCIDAMEEAARIGNEHQFISNRRRGQNMFLQRIRPEQTIRCNISRLRGIDAFKPSLVLAPPNVAATGNIKMISIKNRHAINVARTFTSVAVEFMNIGLRGTRVKVE